MNVQIIQKILQQQKLGSISLWIFNVSKLGIRNKKQALYIVEDCMKKFCESLKEHTKNIIDFEKKKMLPLTKEELKSHQDGKRILKKLCKNINYQKVRDHCHYTGKHKDTAHSVFDLKFNVPCSFL